MCEFCAPQLGQLNSHKSSRHDVTEQGLDIVTNNKKSYAGGSLKEEVDEAAFFSEILSRLDHKKVVVHYACGVNRAAQCFGPAPNVLTECFHQTLSVD